MLCAGQSEKVRLSESLWSLSRAVPGLVRMAQAEVLSAEDVLCLAQMHGGFVGIPVHLQASLCHKLVNGVLDGGNAFYLESLESGGPLPYQTHALIALGAAEEIWLCEHAPGFSSKSSLEAVVRAGGGVDFHGMAQPHCGSKSLPLGHLGSHILPLRRG